MPTKTGLRLYCYTLQQTSLVAGPVEYGSLVSQLSFTTVVPGGMGQLDATLNISNARIPRSELALFSRVAVMAPNDAGSFGLWLGEIMTSELTMDANGEYYRISALGLGNILRDDPQVVSYTNQTPQQIITAQYTTTRSFYLAPFIDSDLSQVFPDNPGTTFSPSYVGRTFEEVLADVSTLAGDYEWGVWPYPTQTASSSHKDGAGFPLGQLTVKQTDRTTKHYTASVAAQDVTGYTIAQASDRAYNSIAIGYFDPTQTNPVGYATARDSRLGTNAVQGTAPFRFRSFLKDYSGSQTVTSAQATNIATMLLSLMKNISTKTSITLVTVRDGNSVPIDPWRVMAGKNIFIPELAVRGTQLATTATGGVNLFHILSAKYSEDSSGQVQVDLQCDNWADSTSTTVARLQLYADQQRRADYASRTTQLIQATGASDTGTAGGTYTNVTAGQPVAEMVQYHTVMANTPTSITLSVISSSNANSIQATSISQYGFVLQWTPPSSGSTTVLVKYTTNGN